MFLHNFKYSFKTLFRNKMLIFWTFIFPIALGTFFYLAFSDIENSEKLDIIDIAIVDNEDFRNNQIMSEAFKSLSEEDSDNQLFNIEYTDIDKAKELLDDNKISGILLLENDDAKVIVKSQGGINETILKSAVEEIEQTSIMIENLTSKEIEEEIKNGNYGIDSQKIVENILNKINSSEVKIKNVSNSNLSYTMIEFYTLIAMTCLYGGILGMVSVNQNMANISNSGKRIAVSAISKGKLILGSVLASFIVQLIGIFLLLMYTILILHVDYGSNLIFVILLAVVGSFAGLSMGVGVATLVKSNDTVKTGIVLAVTMVGCFLSGMMGITMKYLIDKNVPIVNKLNPASMITDGFYSLYYYDTYDRYFFNIMSLLIFAFLIILVSYKGLRRQKYDSI